DYSLIRFFFQAEDGIRDRNVTGVQTCALPISLVARCMRASGVKPGYKVHNAYGYGLFTGGLGAHYGAERLGCAVIPMSGGQTEKIGRASCRKARRSRGQPNR